MCASQYSLTLPDAALILGWPSILAAIATLVVVHRVVYALFFSPLRHIPGPFLARLTGKRAEILGLLGQTVKYSSKETKRYGDIYVYRPNAVVISHPTDIRAVYRSHNFRKTEFYRGVNLHGIETMFSTRNPELADMRRRQMRPYLNTAHLAKVEPILAMHGPESLKAKWDALLAQSSDGSVEINYNKDFLFATFDTMSSLAFGRSTGALARDDWSIVNWMKDTFTYLGYGQNFPVLNIFPFSTLLYPWKHGYDEVTRYTVESVNMRHEYLTTHKDKPVDILQVFVDAEDPQSKTYMTERQVQAESLNTLLAGSEAVATTMMWTVHLLMLHPEHYRRAVDEVRGEFSLDHLVTSVEAHAKLPFLEACLFESMRFHPTSGGLWPRKVPKEGITLQGHFLPGGTEIFTSVTGAHHNPRVWENPLKYDPSRLLDNDEDRRNLFMFGGGVRACPGRHLAVLEMMSILANMLKDYDLAVPKDYVRRGPSVLDENGVPQLMESLHFFVSIPMDSKRDCRLVLTKRTA